MSLDPWICPACTLRQPKSGLCIFCGAPSPEATTDETPYYASLDTGEHVNADVLRKRRQFIISRIRTEFPHLVESEFDHELIKSARKRVRQLVFGEHEKALNSYEKSILLQACFDELFGFGPLGPLVRDPAMHEIRVFARERVLVRKGHDEDFKDSGIEFDDDKHLERLIQNLRARSSPRSWMFPDREDVDHYLTWDGIKLEIAHDRFSEGAARLALIFQEALGSQAHETATETQVRPPENYAVIRQRRQFICGHLKKDAQHAVNAESVEKIRKKLKQLVFGDSSVGKMTSYEKSVLFQECLDEVFGYGPLGQLFRDPEVTEIRVYSPDRTTVCRRGAFESVLVLFDDDAHLRRIVNLLVTQSQPRMSDDATRDEFVAPTGSRLMVARTPSHEEPLLIINHAGRISTLGL